MHFNPQNSTSPSQSTPIKLWLFGCACMVLAMIIIGVITRLTESGLSMVEWRPLIGALPPLTEADWSKEFELYKQSPEFLKKNFWMELNDFKSIYFWEWLHRLWGRMIGLAFALPLLFFWARGMVPAGYKPKFLFLLILGGLQGLMGWYMVKSGLVDIPAVSHYRLAAHLILAAIIYSALIWLGLSLSKIQNRANTHLFVHASCVFFMVTATIVWGAFTAGLDAGLVYNDSFPLMGGLWFPPDFWAKGSPINNILENHSAVQFTHRWLAITSAVAVFSLWCHAALAQTMVPALHAALLMVLLQIGLGIATLLSGVHLHVAVAHQTGAFILLTFLLIILFQTRPRA